MNHDLCPGQIDFFTGQVTCYASCQEVLIVGVWDGGGGGSRPCPCRYLTHLSFVPISSSFMLLYHGHVACWNFTVTGSH